MNKGKRAAALLAALALTLALTGCNAAQKAQEKAAEEAAEAALGGAAGSGVTVDINGDQYTYEDAEGNKLVVGGSEWPAGGAADLLPRCGTGTVTSVVSAEGTCLIDLDGITEADYTAYVQSLQGAGFTDSAVTMQSDENGAYWQATDAAGNTAAVSYDSTLQHLQIMCTLASE